MGDTGVVIAQETIRNMFHAAFVRGHLDVLRYIRGMYEPHPDELRTLVAKNPPISVVEWVFQTYKVDRVAGLWLCAGVVSGSIEIVEFMIMYYGREITDPNCRFWAGACGNLEMTKWYIGRYPQCIITEVYDGAVYGEHTHILAWLDASEHRLTYTQPVSSKSIDTLNWYAANGYIIGDIYRDAITHSRIDLMDWAHMRGMKLTADHLKTRGDASEK